MKTYLKPDAFMIKTKPILFKLQATGEAPPPEYDLLFTEEECPGVPDGNITENIKFGANSFIICIDSQISIEEIRQTEDVIGAGITCSNIEGSYNVTVNFPLAEFVGTCASDNRVSAPYLFSPELLGDCVVDTFLFESTELCNS